MSAPPPHDFSAQSPPQAVASTTSSTAPLSHGTTSATATPELSTSASTYGQSELAIAHEGDSTHDSSAYHTSAPETSAETSAAEDGHAASVLHLVPDPDAPADEESDGDSAFDGHSTASTSLASSIMNYEYSNGRRYHGYRSGAYVLPNDDEEQDRLDFVHHIFLLILDGKLHDAPLPHPPRRVLDIGTGTGIWAIDFGDANPGSEVVGTDLSPIQPTWVPPNVKFYIDDAESDWVYPPEEHFDFIHVRELSGAITDWGRLCQQSYANLQPGGWLELQEPIAWFECDDDTISLAPDVDHWQTLCSEGAEKFGKEITIAHTLKQCMLDAGFIDVHERVMKVPLGPWPKDTNMKEIGRYHREQIIQGVPPYTYGFLGKILGWSEAECKVMIAKVVAQIRNPKLHVYVRYYFVSGRKAGGAHYQ